MKTNTRCGGGRWWQWWSVCVCMRERDCGIWQALRLAFIGELINPQPFDSCQTPPRTYTHYISICLTCASFPLFNYPACLAPSAKTSLLRERRERGHRWTNIKNTDKDFRTKIILLVTWVFRAPPNQRVASDELWLVQSAVSSLGALLRRARSCEGCASR